MRANTETSLLIQSGENKLRVILRQPERVVAAIRATGKEVHYHVFRHEGHAFRHWKYQMAYYRKAEAFPRRCPGRRSSGFDFERLGN